MILLALMVAGMQQQAPELQALADRHHLQVGQELVYTIKAVSHSDQSMQVRVSSLDGFETISRVEQRDVSFNPLVRTSSLELRLRALRPGTYRLGPVVASQGGTRTTIPGASIRVTESPGAVATTVNPRVAELLRKARPPSLAGQVGLTVYLSHDTVVVGQQVDVVTAAWFPRKLRLRLRRPPTLEPPGIDGLWSYPQPAPAGIAATRRVGGAWYDLFVDHDVVFPLTPGTFVLEPARLRYSVPLALQFFSQEERLSLESAAPVVVVRALPTRGRPGDFTGAVGRGLTASWMAPALNGPARVGDPVSLRFRVEGLGNVALWPEPDIVWPESVRVYSDRVEEWHEHKRGLIGGTKTFSYLVVPTGPGTLTIPAVGYSYFDLSRRKYRNLTATAMSIPVAPGSQALVSRAMPPDLIRGGRETVSRRLAHIPVAGWLLAFAIGPLALLVSRLSRRRRHRPRSPREHLTRDLAAAEREFDRLVRLYVPDLEEHLGGALITALAAAGMDHDTARRVGTLRDRLLLARYGPAPAGDDTALIEEVDALVRHIATVPRATLRHRVAAGALLVTLMALMGHGGAAAQDTVRADGRGAGTTPIDLYQSGLLQPAARGFADLARSAPTVTANWYNLGAAEYRLGHDWRAALAWHTALALEPRNARVKRALALVPPPEGDSARRLWLPPVTAAEALGLALVAWLAGWGGIVLGQHWTRRGMVLLVVAGILAVGAGAVAWWHARPLGIALHDTPLRMSPHGRAPTIQRVPAGTTLLLGNHRGGWTLVSLPAEVRGWLPDAAVGRLGGYLPTY